MSLFDATVAQIAKDVSDKTLKPVPNRSSADYCKILWLIRRKTRSWHLPWKSAYKFIPAELTLNDILVQPVDVKSHLSSSVLFQNYTSTPSFHKAGKIGGKIAEEFEVDVDVKETMQISLKLGNVMKQEVLWQKLYETLNGKTVKSDHPLVKLVNSSPKYCLFVIAMIVTSGVTSSFDKDTTVDGDLGGSPQVALNLSSSGSSDSKQHRQYTIPLGTTLVYSCCKLKLIKVENNCVLNLQLGDDVIDAPFKPPIVDEISEVQQALSGLLTNKVNSDLIIMLRKILKTHPTCAFKLNVIVENAIDSLEGDVAPCNITVNQLRTLFPEECYTDCSKFLEMAGFEINQHNLVYPEKLNLLISLNVLLDSLSEMSNAQIQTLTDCVISHRNDILSTIQELTESTDEKKIIQFSEMFTDQHPVARFLKSIGLDLVRTDSSLCVEYLPKCQSVEQLRSLIVPVYGMCSV